MLIRQNNKSLKFIEVSIFISLWLVVLLSPLFVQETGRASVWEALMRHWFRMSPFVLLSIVNHFFLVPYLFFKKKKLWYAISILITILIFSFALNLMSGPNPNQKGHPFPPPSGMRPLLEDRNNREVNPPRPLPGYKVMLPPKLNVIILALLIIGFDTGIKTVFKWTKTDQERLKLEKESIDNQLAMLRNQVHPHFFMNTLNNIHALIDLNTAEAKEAIIRLSQLMRHLLYDSDVALSPIKKELGFVDSYIDLMKLRFSEKVKISLNIPELVPEKSIPPLLFTSLLENAFKHGISYSQASFIYVGVDFSDSKMSFQVRNSRIKKNKEVDRSGLGLENTVKLLDLIYQDKYSLDLNEQEDEFNVKLVIPI